MEFLMNKTNHYTVVFEDGTFYQAVWGGNARSLRLHLEESGYQPTLILSRIRPLYAREGYEIKQLKAGVPGTAA